MVRFFSNKKQMIGTVSAKSLDWSLIKTPIRQQKQQKKTSH
jgi:hypothetical protein